MGCNSKILDSIATGYNFYTVCPVDVKQVFEHQKLWQSGQYPVTKAIPRRLVLYADSSPQCAQFVQYYAVCQHRDMQYSMLTSTVWR